MVNVLSDRDSPQSKATVLLVSDDLESARIWAYSLEQAGLQVCQAGFSEKTLLVWAGEFPDLIVLEDHAARMDALSFCRRMRQEAAVPILILSAASSEAQLMAAYQAGADDCLPPVSPRLFLAKVKAWLRRAQVLPSAALDVVQAGEFRLDPDRRTLTTPQGQALKLTNLETRLLYLMMNHPAWIIETEYLVNRVWGHFGNGDGILLKNLVYRLRRKIEPNPGQPCYLLTESNLGYRFRPEGELPPPAAGPNGGSTPPQGRDGAGKGRGRDTGQLHPSLTQANN